CGLLDQCSSRFCFASCRLIGLEPFGKRESRFRHLTRSSLVYSSQSLSNQIATSKTLLISPTSREYRTSIRLARPLPTTIFHIRSIRHNHERHRTRNVGSTF